MDGNSMSIFATPKAANNGKISYADLIAKVFEQEGIIETLVAALKDHSKLVADLTDRVVQLEASEIKKQSLLYVKDRVSDLLSKRVSDLEQRSRRYCVNIKGVKVKQNENLVKNL